MTTSTPRPYPTSHPNIRIVEHFPRVWRTEVRDDEYGEWYPTGPPYPTRTQARHAVPGLRRDHFGEHDALLAPLRKLITEVCAELDGAADDDDDAPMPARIDDEAAHRLAFAVLDYLSAGAQ